jgi:predicted methyltransferase
MACKSEFQLAVPIAEIEVVDVSQTPQNVSALAASISECGLLHPITVARLDSKDGSANGTSKKYRLWAGHDRLLAAKARGWKDIPALVIEGDEAQLRIIAAQENLVRRKLTCLDESLLLSAWQTAYESRYPLAKRGGDRRRTKEDQSANLAFCWYASDRTPYSSRTIQRLVGIARKVDVEAVKALRGAKMADHQQALEILVREQPDVQVQAVRKAKGNPKNLRMALEDIYRRQRAKSLCDWIHEDVKLWVGDFADVGTQIPDETVDLVIVDPPWTEDSVRLGEPLGQFANRVLKPGGSLLMMLGQTTQLRFLDGVRKHIKDDAYQWWQFSYNYRGSRANLVFNRRLATKWKPCWWVVKGHFDNESYFPDVINVGGDGMDDVVASGGKDKDWHQWGQSVDGFQKFIQYLTAPGDLVVDPCVGGGSSAVASFRLGRKFIGIDIDPESIKMTRLHLESDERTVRNRLAAGVPRLTPARVNARRGLVM